MTHSPRKSPKRLGAIASLCALAILAAGTMAATGTRSSPTPNTPPLEPETQAVVPAKPLPPPTDKTSHSPSNKQISHLAQSNWEQPLTITQCNGIDGHANFRSQPQFGNAVIIGFVARGNPVYLTGQVKGNWLEAIAPLVHVANQATVTNQRGWIADCWQRTVH